MKVQLCCGPVLRPGWLNVDAVDFGQEVIADLNKHWFFLKDEEADYIYCKDGVEHLGSVEHFLQECARTLKPGGVLEINVPHFRNPSAYRLTHRHYFSWSYFDVFPEPHDTVQDLRVTSNRLVLADRGLLWRLANAIINLWPKQWERLLYVSNIEVRLTKVPRPVATSGAWTGACAETGQQVSA